MNKLINANSREKENYEYLIQFFKQELRRAKEKKFLIVLDNLVEVGCLESFFVLLPKNVYIIITTRDARVLCPLGMGSMSIDKQATKVKIDYFSQEQAENLFNKKIDTSNRTISDEENKLLEEYFGKGQVLPYDLNLLLTVLNENSVTSVGNFLDGDCDVCEKIFKELYIIIEKQSKEAWLSLEYFSFVDPDAIPRYLAMKFLNIEDRVIFQEHLNILKKNGIVETHRIKDEWFLRVHRRTQEMVNKVVLKNEQKCQNIQKNLVEKITNEMPEVEREPDEKWGKANNMISHCIKIEKFLEKDELLDKIAAYFALVALDFKKAINYCVQI